MVDTNIKSEDVAQYENIERSSVSISEPQASDTPPLITPLLRTAETFRPAEHLDRSTDNGRISTAINVPAELSVTSSQASIGSVPGLSISASLDSFVPPSTPRELDTNYPRPSPICSGVSDFAKIINGLIGVTLDQPEEHPQSLASPHTAPRIHASTLTADETDKDVSALVDTLANFSLQLESEKGQLELQRPSNRSLISHGAIVSSYQPEVLFGHLA